MRYFYYPGCSLEGTATEYDVSTRAVMYSLGVDLIELEDWTCCGASAGDAVSYLLAMVLPARNLALAERTGIEAFLKQGNLDVSLSRLLAKLAYWIIIFVVIVTVANSLGLHMVAELFNKVVLYIPNIIVAILVLVFGVLIARFINRMVFAYLNNMGVQGALTISTLSEYGVIIFVVFGSFVQT